MFFHHKYYGVGVALVLKTGEMGVEEPIPNSVETIPTIALNVISINRARIPQNIKLLPSFIFSGLSALRINFDNPQKKYKKANAESMGLRIKSKLFISSIIPEKVL
jgi:hypothetical protein